MHRPLLVFALLGGLLGTTACLSPMSPAQKLADCAYDMNLASRFGRMDVVLEHVSAKARDEYTKQHAAWGKTTRIVDIDFSGLRVTKPSVGEVIVTLTWQRPDESNIRVTTLVQRWTETKGSWTWASEEAKGDGGLLGEEDKAAPSSLTDAPATAPKSDRARYQTRVIYGTED